MLMTSTVLFVTAPLVSAGIDVKMVCFTIDFAATLCFSLKAEVEVSRKYAVVLVITS